VGAEVVVRSHAFSLKQGESTAPALRFARARETS
jgi:hypothetical protein